MKQNNANRLIPFILSTLLISSIFVILAYYFFDKPVAIWFYNHMPPYQWMFISLTHIPNILVIICLLGYITYIVAWQLGRVNTHMTTLLLMCHSIVITNFIKDKMKWFFGRDWPLSWTHNNPALIPDNIYGFNLMHGNQMHESFPSGHTAITFAALTVIFIRYPRLRWVVIPCMLLVPLSLVVLDYHFVADILAGGTLGFLVAKCCVDLSFNPAISNL